MVDIFFRINVKGAECARKEDEKVRLSLIKKPSAMKLDLPQMIDELIEEGYNEAMRAKDEAKCRDDGWSSGWNRSQTDKIWTEEEVRDEHRRDRENRMKYWWGGPDLDRGDDLREDEVKEHRFKYPRGMRAGWFNRATEDTYNRWTPKYIVARDWTSHWKYKRWERQRPETTWTGKMEHSGTR